MEIGVVVPTVRPEKYKEFVKAWYPLFKKHDVNLIAVMDGDDPTLQMGKGVCLRLSEVKKLKNLVFNKNDGVRNFGFWAFSSMDIIITLDDDTRPYGDTIQDHIDTLNRRVPISWTKSCSGFTRGFPYCVRDEAPVMISHGLWRGVADWDAPSQLVNGNPDIELIEGPVPKGIYMPFCGMNVAFRREVLPYMYYAPMGYKVGMDRFADIWLGINLTRICAEKNWAIYNGGAIVRHDRASNVWTNLKKEAKGLGLNESYWSGDETDEYFKLYNRKRKQWERLMTKQM